MTDNFNIIIDTREKKDIFLFSSYGAQTTQKALKTGDYSVEGFESKITIDRKRSSSELQLCLFSQYDRFSRELERMKIYDEAYILCSFPFEHVRSFPLKSKMPKRVSRRFKNFGPYFIKRLRETQEEYPYVEFLFSDNQQDAEYKAYRILRNYYESRTNKIV